MNWNRPVLFTCLAFIWATASAQSPTTAGAYTEAQAANGKKNYDRYCADCHHMSLKGTGHGPELAGPNFLANWGKRPLSELISYNFELMPPQAPRLPGRINQHRHNRPHAADQRWRRR